MDRSDKFLLSHIVVFLVLVAFVSAYGGDTYVEPPIETPSPGYTLTGEIVDVYDGDTLTVEYKFRTKVRLLNCWAPEIRTKDLTEKEAGLKSAAHLREFADCRSCVVHIPTGDAKNLADIMTFGRVLGFVYVDGENLSKYQTDEGFATKEKQKE